MAVPIHEAEQKLYSMSEQMIVAKMEMLMNGKPFYYLNIDTSIPEPERARRKEIVTALSELVMEIRSKKTGEAPFTTYQDSHFDDPDHVWLQEQHPGINVTGWRVIMVLMDPLKYGLSIDRSLSQVHGTISQRSARI